ncbi:hypothetical protein WJX82_004037 [Trebouxia sp. C0006]
MTIGQATTAAGVITCLAKALSEQNTRPHVQFFISSYANFSWVNHLFYQMLVEGAVADPATGSVFAFLPGVTASVDIEIPDAVPGEVVQETAPPFARLYPAHSGAVFGMFLQLPVLADLVGNSAEPRTGVQVIDPHQVAVDHHNFGSLVFPLLKLFFTPHPYGGNRDHMFFKLDSVPVTPQECHQLLGQLQAMVNRIGAESPHPVDRWAPLECCQLVNKSLWSDWDSYPHSFLLYHEGHIQVVSLQDQMDPFCQQHIIPCGGKLQDALRPYMIEGHVQPVTARLIFTDAPQQYNTVALREELLASALLGSGSKQALVHEVLHRHRYILTLDYTMKMLHLEERRQSGVLTIMSSETGAMQMHAQVSVPDMWAKLKPFISRAAACPDQHFTFFVDELNTSSMMGEMKSIFIDKSFEGVKLPSNIFWEKDYVTAKLQQVAIERTGLVDFSEDACRLLMRYITTAQGFVKQHLEEAAVSQRDLQRVFNLLAFFIQHHIQRRQDLPQTVPQSTEGVVHRSLLLSLAVAYYFRLNRHLRHEFLALRENFFCIAVCVETKTPLVIIGTPGNSKTLSFKLAADRLRGSSSSSKLFRLFHAVDLFHYQCSQQSTSQEIGTVCARALERQTRHAQLQQRSIATVLLDEGGLPGDEKEALKIVHYLWDDAVLAYVTISNRPLDAAKRSGSSRDLHHFFKYLARHHRRGDRVEMSTATVLEALQRNFGGLPSSDFRQVVEAFLEHLRRACGPHRFPEPRSEDFSPTLEVLAASLSETGHSYIEQHATLSDKSARPKLVIDYTGDDSAYRLLFSSYHAGSPILDKDCTKVFQMSAFKDDQSSEAQKQMIGEIRKAIECGDTCFLMYTEAIHGSLYDLFNQFFTVQRDKDQNAKLYVQIGIGSYSKPCNVHPEARIVVHTPARLLHTLQAPFLDRFEKYAVSVDSFWELLRAQKDAASQHVLDEVLAKGQELITMLGPGTFYGAVPDSTVTTVLLSVLQNCLPDDNQLTATAAVDAQSLVRVLVRAVASHLLQIMKPHSFLQQAHTGVRLPAAYEHFFNNRQEHYNLKQLFCSILSTKPLPSLAFEGIDSADELTQAYAEAAADEPESSAAGEARAAAAASPHLLQNSPQLLQSSPPESKWVIFTSTTPDLDMGYVLPAGRETGEQETQRRHAMLRSYVMDQPEVLVVHRLEHLTFKAACLAAVQNKQLSGEAEMQYGVARSSAAAVQCNVDIRSCFNACPQGGKKRQRWLPPKPQHSFGRPVSDTHYASFRPAHEFPLFADVHTCMENIKDDALLSLESSERSGCELVAAAMQERIASDTGTAALQACLSLDANLRLRYAKSVARSRLDVPGVWFSQQLPYGSMVENWLMQLWPDGNLSILHVQLHLHETQLAAGVMLLKQMTGSDQQQAAQAVECLLLDLVKRIGKTQDAPQGLQDELSAGLHALFNSGLPVGKHMQEYILIELLSPRTLQPANRAKRTGVRSVLQQFPGEQAEGLSVVLRVEQAELVCVPKVYDNHRVPEFGAISSVGLGDWTEPWANAMRPSQDQHAAHQPAVCSTEAYVGSQRQFQALISAHASDDPQNPSDAAVVGAQRWLDIVDQTASAADASGKRTLKSSLILLAYYHLFDMHRYSPALAEICPRLAAALDMTPKEGFVLKFLAHLSSQDLNHVHGRVRRTFPLGSIRADVVGGAHFDCGVQFTEDHDMVGAQPPLQDPASAHFVTLLSWGAFCLGHMFFDDVHATIYGPVMSHRGIDSRIRAALDHAWLSTFMLMRVESCWRGLQLKAGLSTHLCMLVLNQGLHNLLNTEAAKQADRQTFGSKQECVALESALRDVFYAAYNRRQEMQAEVEALQTASQLRQQFQQWNKEAYGLLSAFLARRSEWEALKCIRPALHIYNWAHTALRGLVTVEQTLNTSLHEYIAAFRQKDAAAGMRLERMWADLKLYWNKFHASKNGFVANDCQPNSAFSALSDQTCLATFLGVRSEDNELVKVLKALMMLQNNFLENAQEHGLPQTLASMPVHLLTHSSMDQYLLQSHPFHFDSYVYSQVGSDTTPLEFNLERLTHLVAQNLASKRQYVAVMRVMLQVLREDEDCCFVQPKVWVEVDIRSPRHKAQQIRPALLRLPIWTDAVASPVQKPSQSADPARSPHTNLSLPQSISWQRIPEPMLVKAIRMRFKHQSAPEAEDPDEPASPVKHDSQPVMDWLQHLAPQIEDHEMEPAPELGSEKAGFDTKEDAVAWLGADCYLKTKTALCLLGVRCSSEVALLQAEQVKGVVGIKPIPRKKLFLILDKVVSDSDRIQWVFKQYQPWLEENLGMEKAGDAHLMQREEAHTPQSYEFETSLQTLLKNLANNIV